MFLKPRAQDVAVDSAAFRTELSLDIRLVNTHILFGSLPFRRGLLQNSSVDTKTGSWSRKRGPHPEKPAGLHYRKCSDLAEAMRPYSFTSAGKGNECIGGISQLVLFA